MEIIAYPGSGIEEVADIEGGKLAFTSPTSNSGFKAPSAILKSDFGLIAERDFEEDALESLARSTDLIYDVEGARYARLIQPDDQQHALLEALGIRLPRQTAKAL